MSLREWMANNPAITATAVIVVLGLALGMIYWQMREPTLHADPDDVYFFDMGTSEVFAAGGHEVPPIAAPSGAEGVRAYLYSCGACTPDAWFGYLETYTEEGRRLMEQGYSTSNPVAQETMARSRLIRPLDGGEWIPMDTREGQRLQEEAHARCGSAADRVICRPS